MNSKSIVSIVALAAIVLLENVFPYFKGRKARFIHAFPNLIVGLLGGIISSLIFSGLILSVITRAQANSFGLVHLLNIHIHLKALLMFVLFDLWMYLWHFANHRILLLWRFHRMHHSDTEMDATTAVRFHPGEHIFSSLLRIPVFLLLGMSRNQLLIYEMFLLPIILFHHSNLGLPEKWDRILRACIVTPNMHRVHHSHVWLETNSNYSSIFSFWDRIFNSFRKRDDTLTIKFGLRILREQKWQRLWGMLSTPFK